MQQTFGIVPVYTRNDILKKISKLEIIAERRFELSIESASKILNKKIREAYTVFGFILEGSNAIEDWLNIIHDASQSKSLYHGSLNPDHAHTEIDWFKSTFGKDSVSSSSSSSSIPVKVINRKTISSSKKPTTTTKKSTVSGTSPHQSRVRDTTSSADGPRNSLRKPTPIVRTSKTPNNVKSTTTPPPLKSSRITPPSTKPPVKRSEIVGRSDLAAGRAESRRSSLATATTTKKLSTTAKGGVSKNTPPTSVITGRTRKPSKLTEKRPLSLAKPKPVQKPVQEDEAIVVESITQPEPAEAVEAIEAIEAVEAVELVEAVEPTPVEIKEEVEQVQPVAEEEIQVETITDEKEIEAEIEEHSIAKEEEVEEECHIILAQQPVSHPSTSSSADEHDAEVAAAINNEHQNHVKMAANLFQNSGRSSSFSPNSVSSLPRPETPEVDQLRLRFETIIQTSSPNTPTSEFQPFPRRPSSKMSPEFISRIKDMKPKGPVGTKVKSMVELFMDENLNKWEF